MSKKPYFKDQDHADFIRTQYCHICGSCDDINDYGDPVVTPSHIVKKGMGGANTDPALYEYNNLLPQCTRCHQWFETLPRVEREFYKDVAEQFTYMFFDE